MPPESSLLVYDRQNLSVRLYRRLEAQVISVCSHLTDEFLVREDAITLHLLVVFNTGAAHRQLQGQQQTASAT